jgi:hypothetical protein
MLRIINTAFDKFISVIASYFVFDVIIDIFNINITLVWRSSTLWTITSYTARIDTCCLVVPVVAVFTVLTGQYLIVVEDWFVRRYARSTACFTTVVFTIGYLTESLAVISIEESWAECFIYTDSIFQLSSLITHA